MCTHIFLARRKLQFYFWNLDGWTKQSTPWNPRSQNLTVNTVKCHFHDLLMALVHCWSWLLPVFVFLLEDQLSEPEIMLMFKDKLKASDLGYQLEGKEEGSMFSCEVGGQPFAVCVFPKQSRVSSSVGWGRAARPEPLSRGLPLLPHYSFPQPAVEGSLSYLDSQWFHLSFLVWKTGVTFIFWFGWKGPIVIGISYPFSESGFDITEPKPSKLLLCSWVQQLLGINF